jgi:hypothetical protein
VTWWEFARFRYELRLFTPCLLFPIQFLISLSNLKLPPPAWRLVKPPTLRLARGGHLSLPQWIGAITGFIS